jgi:hypothetical protein
MSDLQAKPFVFDCPAPNGGGSSNGSEAKLKTVAKRYTLGNSAENTEGLTLLFAHGIGSRESFSGHTHVGVTYMWFRDR